MRERVEPGDRGSHRNLQELRDTLGWLRLAGCQSQVNSYFGIKIFNKKFLKGIAVACQNQLTLLVKPGG